MRFPFPVGRAIATRASVWWSVSDLETTRVAKMEYVREIGSSGCLFRQFNLQRYL